MADERGLRIGAFAGADIIIQPAFAFLAAYMVGAEIWSGGLAAAPGAIVFVALLFAAVLIHEFGHAAMAAALGIESERIVLTFFGGYVRFANPPRERWREIAVSAAGPLANLACWPLAFYAARAIGQSLEPSMGALFWLTQLQNFAYISLVLGAFNLLPGWPLDGGHMLRAGLGYFTTAARAAFVASVCGLLVAGAIAAYGIIREALWTAVIGALLGAGAWAELQRARALLARGPA